jgi:hypothetical protein
VCLDFAAAAGVFGLFGLVTIVDIFPTNDPRDRADSSALIESADRNVGDPDL